MEEMVVILDKYKHVLDYRLTELTLTMPLVDQVPLLLEELVFGLIVVQVRELHSTTLFIAGHGAGIVNAVLLPSEHLATSSDCNTH